MLDDHSSAKPLGIRREVFFDPRSSGFSDRKKQKQRTVILTVEVGSKRGRTAGRYKQIGMRRHHCLQKEEDASKCWEGLRWVLPPTGRIPSFEGWHRGFCSVAGAPTKRSLLILKRFYSKLPA